MLSVDDVVLICEVCLLWQLVVNEYGIKVYCCEIGVDNWCVVGEVVLGYGGQYIDMKVFSDGVFYEYVIILFDRLLELVYINMV